jgi:hypothetical protein
MSNVSALTLPTKTVAPIKQNNEKKREKKVFLSVSNCLAPDYFMR